MLFINVTDGVLISCFKPSCVPAASVACYTLALASDVVTQSPITA